MKRILVAVSGLVVAASLMAQGTSTGGTVNAINKSGTTVNALGYEATLVGGSYVLGAKLGSAYVAQLLVGATEASLAPVGAVIPFKDSGTPPVGTGIFSGGKVKTTLGQGTAAFAQVLLFPATYANYDAAFAAGAKVGKSTVIPVSLGGDDLSPPVVPGNLVGLKGAGPGGELIAVAAIPEPTTIALGLLGAAALLLRRRS